ncbi:hypothetical protein KP509_1Z005100 [Ceratopteris richardii]|nr:hypothetical protein KP509_1Z005100 [Ceratopteris richardii]
MYAKCGNMVKAQCVFNVISTHNTVLWTALIGGYADHGEGEKALKCYSEMRTRGIHPNRVTYICTLKACTTVGDIINGQAIHAETERQGLLENDPILGNSILFMYMKCGILTNAQEVFDRLSTRNIVTWTSLILGFVERGHGEDAIDCFERMQAKGIPPNTLTFGCVLKACSNVGHMSKGEDVHSEIERQGILQKDVALGNTLIDMYAKFGQLTKAREVFSRMSASNVVTWTTLISAHTECGYPEEALTLFNIMQTEVISPNSITLISSLKACGRLQAVHEGILIHVEIERQGLLARHSLVANALVDMYVKCGILSLARQNFDQLSIHDVVSWNTIISGYSEHGYGTEALQCYEQMQVEGALADAITYASGFKACGLTRNTCKGYEIHSKSEGYHPLKDDDMAYSMLVDMYVKFGLLNRAKQAFSKLFTQNVYSWTSLITGYVEHGHGEEALKCFEQMQLRDLSPSPATFISVVKACGMVGSLLKGEEVYIEIEKRGLIEDDHTINNCLFFMYSKCGSLDSARQLFDSIPVHDVVSWSALIAMYTEHELGEDALDCFQKMQLLGITPNAVTLVSGLKACGCICAIDKGREMHAEIERQGLMEGCEVLGNALISMYAKCGLVAFAKQVFDELPDRDVVSWTILMAGYAQLGQSENVFHVFSEMKGWGIEPSPVSYVVVLNACNRGGLHNTSKTLYDAMSRDHGIVPTSVHYNCMLDVFSRMGQLDEIRTILKKNPFGPSLVASRSILGACKSGGSLDLADMVFTNISELDKKDSASYVLMSQIYASTEL